jgi:hypothetical protein
MPIGTPTHYRPLWSLEPWLSRAVVHKPAQNPNFALKSKRGKLPPETLFTVLAFAPPLSNLFPPSPAPACPGGLGTH